MGIDGIGGGPPKVPGAPGSPGVADSPAGSFRVGPSDAAGAADGADAADPSAPLDRLRAGEIDLDQYLDARVSEAVRHLEGRLPSSQLDFVRAELRAQLGEDPVLVELVRRATGGAAG